MSTSGDATAPAATIAGVESMPGEPIEGRRPGMRPAGVRPPAHLSPSPPVPTPQAVPLAPEHDGRNGLDPTRYGDWELKGIAVDF